MSKPMTYDEYLAKQMEDPEFWAEWDALEPEFEVACAIIEGKSLIGFPPGTDCKGRRCEP